MPDGQATRPSVASTAILVGDAAYWLSLFIIASCILVIDLNTNAKDYADIDTYLIYLSQLVNFPDNNWYYFEAFSNFYLLFIHWLVRSVDESIEFAHYLLGIIFFSLLVIALPPKQSSWKSLLFVFAMFGPLLAFVTLRATPSYFLVAVGVQCAMRRSPKTWIYLSAAFFFHASALLAAGPIMFLYFRDSLPTVFRAERPVRLFVIATVLLVVVGIIAPQITKNAITLFESVPVLSKYIAYTDQGSSINESTSLSHYIFFVFVSGFTLLFLVFPVGNNRHLNEYVLISYVLYAALFVGISPVAAVRQAPFWLIPMIASYPWQRVWITETMTPLFLLVCGGLCYFQFGQVYL